MEKNQYYTGIDVFRMAAALWVIAIHTSPLASCSEMGDFIFTRIIARTAVPFFFMTSGFFAVSRYGYCKEKLAVFVKKTVWIYVFSILLYLPLNIYNDYFKMENLLPNIIKDIVFDGTMYHLWYLPASAIGAVIAWCLVKRFSYHKALGIGFFLYLAGMLGDSYYGIAERIPLLKYFYTLIFQVSDYTRNGVFFAPVFFILGGYFADYRKKTAFWKSIAGFLASLSGMILEGCALHHFGLQRHDSMYLFLLPCMYFLFSLILHFRGKRLENVRTAALAVYILHPMVIVAVRLLAKSIHQQEILVENSMVYYLMVSAGAVSAGIIMTVLWSRIRPQKETGRVKTGRTYIEINLQNLEHNVKVLQEAMPPKCELMAVVKAEAYGHGAIETAAYLNKTGIKAFAAATIDEAIKLRKYGVVGEILILGYTDVSRAKELKKYKLTQTLIDYEYAKALNRQQTSVKAHIKIDTGMHRLGIPDTGILEVKRILKMENLEVNGMFTHLCSADSRKYEDVKFTRQQIAGFYQLVDCLKECGISIPKIHIQSSYGLLNYPNLQCDYVRAGIALYGVTSSPKDETVLKLDLRPVLSLKSRVVLLRQVNKGESVGYGRSFVAERDSRIAILPVGYADGFPRNLSNRKSEVIIRGQYAPIVGRICMDQLAVDVTDLEHAEVGDTAVLISTDKRSLISAPFVAEKSGSISNELLSRMGARLPVAVKE